MDYSVSQYPLLFLGTLFCEVYYSRGGATTAIRLYPRQGKRPSNSARTARKPAPNQDFLSFFMVMAI
jgi:hypothetical protein